MAQPSNAPPSPQHLEMQPIEPNTTTHPGSNPATSIFPLLDVAKSLICVCFTSLLTMLTFMNQNYRATGSRPPVSFYIFCVALLLAFCTLVCEVSIRKWSAAAAGVMERIALVSMVTAFFALMRFLLPDDLGWLLFIPFLLVLVSILHPIIRGVIIMYQPSSVVPNGRSTLVTVDEESALPSETTVAERDCELVEQSQQVYVRVEERGSDAGLVSSATVPQGMKTL